MVSNGGVGGGGGRGRPTTNVPRFFFSYLLATIDTEGKSCGTALAIQLAITVQRCV